MRPEDVFCIFLAVIAALGWLWRPSTREIDARLAEDHRRLEVLRRLVKRKMP